MTRVPVTITAEPLSHIRTLRAGVAQWRWLHRDRNEADRIARQPTTEYRRNE